MAFRMESRKRVFASTGHQSVSVDCNPQHKKQRGPQITSTSQPIIKDSTTVLPPVITSNNSTTAGTASQVNGSVAALSERLETTVAKCWQTRATKYSRVHALLLFWEEDDIAVSNDVDALENVLKARYHYDTQVSKIKAPKANQELQRKVLDFLEAYDSPQSLLIIYYIGGSELGVEDSEAPLWIPAKSRAPFVQTAQVQLNVVDSESDVLMLWDCSYGPKLSTQPVNCSSIGNVTEVLTAGWTSTVTAARGEVTFTQFMIDQLAKATEPSGVRVIDMHKELVACLESKGPPAALPSGDAPAHGWLSNMARSIVLAPHATKTNGVGTATQNGSNDAKFEMHRGEAGDETPQGAFVTVCFRISATGTPLSDWQGWLAQAPRHSHDSIKVSGYYASFSPLITLMIPLEVWQVLPQCPTKGLRAFKTDGIDDLVLLNEIETALAIKMEESAEAAESVAHMAVTEVAINVDEMDDGYALRDNSTKIRKALPSGRRLLPSEPRTLLPNDRRELLPASSYTTQTDSTMSPSAERKALPTARKLARITSKPAGPAYSCNECNGVAFRDEEGLALHIRKMHLRPFPCVFNWAGCKSNFASKNEWKRHVMSQHILLNYWLCELDSCSNTVNTPQNTNGANSPVLPNGTIFNRKDLFMQHVRRMHTPPDIKKLIKTQKANKTAPSTAVTAFEEQTKTYEKEAYKQRCDLPAYMRCPATGCGHEFRGLSAWDDRMEHVAKHLEKAAAGKEGPVTFGGSWDLTLTTWATRPDVGIVTVLGLNRWQLNNPLKPETFVAAAPAGAVGVVGTDGTDGTDSGDDAGLVGSSRGVNGSPDLDRDERSKSVIEVAEGQHSHHHAHHYHTGDDDDGDDDDDDDDGDSDDSLEY